MKTLAYIGGLLCLIVFALPSYGAEPRVDTIKQGAKDSAERVVPPLEQSSKIMLRNCKAYVEDLEKQLEAMQSSLKDPQVAWYQYYYGKYMKQKADVQIDTFIWQQKTSQWMLWIVTAVVLSGLVFSAIQLSKAVSSGLPRKITNTNKLGASAAKEQDTASAESSIEVSVQHIRVTSSVIGIIVLAISVLFYYLFLKEVYHIQVIDTVKAQAHVEGSR